MFCNCDDVCQIYHGNNYDKMCEVLSTLKKRKMKINNILIEKYKVTKKILVSNNIIIAEHQ